MFKSIIAQNKAKTIISEQIKNNKIPHGYIFMGEDGIGKNTTAIEFVKILNCTINDYTKTDVGACNHCIACEQINKGSYPDLHIINFAKQAEILEEDVDKQKTLKIDTIRYMQKNVYMKATEGKWKVFILEPAEKMTTAAANCLLKTLEEPPENTIIILIAKHKETIPITIVSRAQTVFFQPLPTNEIANYLQQQHSLSIENSVKIANLSDGSIEKAEMLMLNTQNEYSSLWSELTSKKLAAVDILNKSKSVSKDRKSVVEAVNIITESAIKNFRREPYKYTDIIEKLTESKKYLNQNVNPNTVLDDLFIYINSKIK
ncbi:MAG: DNA polymerase III subunit delta' [Endomicrobiaceae bacterium]|nr:DNA polymerase III subunit delta' [Endomicrobiaceae bacterium]MDD3053338.1 DNA polymerase III subunit delta' [Endomicrobiaceae bacterium]MDD3922263.1 DNA polymerase III subunit delta' [Endomicrobiaceae bacterium]